MLPEDTIARRRALQAGARLSRLYDDHARMVLGVCRVLLRDPHDAEDAAQQAFLSAHRALLSGTEPRDPAAWLAAIARNECRARVRARMAAPVTAELDEELDALGVPAVEDAAQRNEVVRALRAALAELPERQRQAIVLREFYGLRQDEIAAALELAEPSVESTLWRARRTLAERNVDGALTGALLVPPRLREELRRLVPGFETTRRAVQGVSLAAKLVGAGAALVTAVSIGGGSSSPAPPAPRAETPPSAPATVTVVTVTEQEEDDDDSGRGRGRGRSGSSSGPG